MSPREAKRTKQKDIKSRLACFIILPFHTEDENRIFSETSVEQATKYHIQKHNPCVVQVAGSVSVTSLFSLTSKVHCIILFFFFSKENPR